MPSASTRSGGRATFLAIEIEADVVAAGAGRTPTTGEIAALTGFPVETIRAVRSAEPAPVSLDEPILRDGSPLAGVVADPHAADPELIALEHDRARHLTSALASLPERQRRIVISNWGLGRDRCRTAR